MTDTITNPENVTESGGHSDIITATASPRPWRSEPSELVGTNCLIDANGTYVATVANIDAALIVKAVNKHGMPIVELLNAYDALEAERDRLRDIVKRIEEEVDRCHKRDGQISQELIDAVYEARAAITEEVSDDHNA